MDNNQKGAFTILGTLAAVLAVTKYKNKMRMPTMSSVRRPSQEDLSYDRLVDDMKMGSFSKHSQGYRDRMDESLGMRTGAERDFTQSMKDRRNESYGKFGMRGMEHPHQHINR